MTPPLDCMIQSVWPVAVFPEGPLQIGQIAHQLWRNVRVHHRRAKPFALPLRRQDLVGEGDKRPGEFPLDQLSHPFLMPGTEEREKKAYRKDRGLNNLIV